MTLAFSVDATCGAARTGTVTTERGSFSTPCFMPVGTRGAVRTLSSADLESLGADTVLALDVISSLSSAAASEVGSAERRVQISDRGVELAVAAARRSPARVPAMPISSAAWVASSTILRDSRTATGALAQICSASLKESSNSSLAEMKCLSMERPRRGRRRRSRR